jgi:RNA polymerase primary sigma factor
VRLPPNVIKKLSNLKKEIERFEFENEREPIYGEILDKNNEAVELILYPTCTSLNDVINEDGDEMIDILATEPEDDKLVIDEKVKEELAKALEILDERERNIIENYFGINTDCEPMTLDAIGERYNLTKERIRQIKEKAIRKLRFAAGGLYDLLHT